MGYYDIFDPTTLDDLCEWAGHPQNQDHTSCYCGLVLGDAVLPRGFVPARLIDDPEYVNERVN